jgi:amidase
MSMASLAYLPALDQAALVRRREVSPSELVRLCLERVEDLDSRVGAFVAVAADSALADAATAERAIVRGASIRPFEGVPLAVKSMMETAGLLTTFPTFSQWAGYIPDTDESVIAKLKKSGFIIFGKTKVTGVTTDSPLNGTTTPCRNPWNLRYAVGGSSGGSAAAVAAGMCPVALGGDNGGSIRIPSAWCGLFGLKPSRGRVSTAPNPWDLYYTAGPMARTVADAAAMLDAMSGYVAGDAEDRHNPPRVAVA